MMVTYCYQHGTPWMKHRLLSSATKMILFVLLDRIFLASKLNLIQKYLTNAEKLIIVVTQTVIPENCLYRFINGWGQKGKRGNQIFLKYSNQPTINKVMYLSCLMFSLNFSKFSKPHIYCRSATVWLADLIFAPHTKISNLLMFVPFNSSQFDLNLKILYWSQLNKQAIRGTCDNQYSIQFSLFV